MGTDTLARRIRLFEGKRRVITLCEARRNLWK
jgi:hypothetical protein